MSDIVFDEIPYDVLEPGTFLEVKPNYRNVGILPYRQRRRDATAHACLLGGPLPSLRFQGVDRRHRAHRQGKHLPAQQFRPQPHGCASAASDRRQPHGACRFPRISGVTLG